MNLHHLAANNTLGQHHIDLVVYFNRAALNCVTNTWEKATSSGSSSDAQDASDAATLPSRGKAAEDLWDAPLHLAARHGHKDAVHLLITAKADVNVQGGV